MTSPMEDVTAFSEPTFEMVSSGEMASSASVAATTSSTVTPSAVSSSVARPSGKPITASSVTTRLTGRSEVSGREHSRTIFGRPLAVCCMATITRLAPATRSMAPPMPGTILPGTIQLARRPCWSTCRPPSTVRSRCPPRIRPKDIALSNVDAPGRAVTGFPPASVSHGSAMPGSATGPVPIRPFSDWKKTCIPLGTKLATRVGMPMPRLTSIPSRSSCAMRLAMRDCESMASAFRDEVVDDRRGRHDMVRRDDAHRHDVLRLDDHGLRSHRHQWVEVARRKGVLKITQIVGDEGVHEREVGAQGRLQQIVSAIHRNLLLALRDDRADAGGGQDAAEPEAASANAFGKRALWDEIHLQAACQHP